MNQVSSDENALHCIVPYIPLSAQYPQPLGKKNLLAAIFRVRINCYKWRDVSVHKQHKHSCKWSMWHAVVCRYFLGFVLDLLFVHFLGFPGQIVCLTILYCQEKHKSKSFH